MAGAAAAALAWLGLRGDAWWSVRLLGLQTAAGLRVHGGLGAARLLGRSALVLLGDSRLEMMGSDGIDPGGRWLVPAGLSGTTARLWSGVLASEERGTAPVVFVIWLGVNDVVNERASGDDVVRRLRAITDYALRGSDDRVLLLEQFPLALPPSAEAARVERELRVINSGLAAMAEADARVDLLPLWTRLGAQRGADGCADCLLDALHLNERGNAFVRELLSAALRQR
jgi:lysophospholipase L1-like esterase